MQSFKLKFSGVTILQGVEFPIFLLIFEWALQQCSATALPVIGLAAGIIFQIRRICSEYIVSYAKRLHVSRCCLAYVCVALITPDMEFVLAITTMQPTMKQLLKRLPVITATELSVQLYTAS